MAGPSGNSSGRFHSDSRHSNPPEARRNDRDLGVDALTMVEVLAAVVADADAVEKRFGISTRTTLRRSGRS